MTRKRTRAGITLIALTAILSVSLFSTTSFITSAATSDELYVKACNAVVTAQKSGKQSDINYARLSIAALENTDAAWSVGEFSKQLDQLQQPILVNIYNAVQNAQASKTQAAINNARQLLSPELPEVLRNSYSTALDKIQQQLINQAYGDYLNAISLNIDYDKALSELDTISSAYDTSVSDWAKNIIASLNSKRTDNTPNYNPKPALATFSDSNLLSEDAAIAKTNIGSLDCSSDGSVLFGIKDILRGTIVKDLLKGLTLSSNCTAYIKYIDADNPVDLSESVSSDMLIRVTNSSKKIVSDYYLETVNTITELTSSDVVEKIDCYNPELYVVYGTPQNNIPLARFAKLDILHTDGGNSSHIYLNTPIIWDRSLANNGSTYYGSTNSGFVTFYGHIKVPGNTLDIRFVRQQINVISSGSSIKSIKNLSSIYTGTKGNSRYPLGNLHNPYPPSTINIKEKITGSTKGMPDYSINGSILYGIKDVPVGTTVWGLLSAITVPSGCTKNIVDGNSLASADWNSTVDSNMMIEIANEETGENFLYYISLKYEYNPTFGDNLSSINAFTPIIQAKVGTSITNLPLSRQAKISTTNGTSYGDIDWTQNIPDITSRPGVIMLEGKVILPPNLIHLPTQSTTVYQEVILSN